MCFTLSRCSCSSLCAGQTPRSPVVFCHFVWRTQPRALFRSVDVYLCLFAEVLSVGGTCVPAWFAFASRPTPKLVHVARILSLLCTRAPAGPRCWEHRVVCGVVTAPYSDMTKKTKQTSNNNNNKHKYSNNNDKHTYEVSNNSHQQQQQSTTLPTTACRAGPLRSEGEGRGRCRKRTRSAATAAGTGPRRRSLHSSRGKEGEHLVGARGGCPGGIASER